MPAFSMLYLGSLITAASGKLNGVVAARNRGGQYFREHVVPIDPLSARQVNCRDALVDCWNWWTTEMSAAQRAAWETYAKEHTRPGRLGVRRELPGWQAFCRQHFVKFQVNQQLAAGTDPGYVPPIYPSGLTAVPAMVHDTSNTYNVTYPDDNSWQLDQDNGFAVYLSAPQPGTRNFFKGPFQLAAAIIGDSETPPDFPYAVTFGTVPTAGQRVWYRIIFFSNDKERAGPFVGFMDI